MAARDRDLIDPQAEEAAAFFYRLFGDAAGHLTLFTDHPPRTHWFDLGRAGAIEDAAERAVEIAEKQDVWFGCGLRASQLAGSSRGSAEHITVLPGLWVDIDIGKPNAPVNRREAEQLIKAFPLEPTLVVVSGGGLHCYWLLGEPYEIESDEERRELIALGRGWHRALQRVAGAHGYALDNTSDLARILRIPGTANLKTGKRRPVSIVHDSGATYTFTDFDQLVPDDDVYEAPDATAEGFYDLADAAITNIIVALKSTWKDGYRHHLVKLLAGWLANNEISERAAAELVRRGSVTYGDQDPDEKQRTVRDTYAKLRRGVRPIGWAGLKQLLAVEELHELDRVLKPVIVANRRASKTGDGDAASSSSGFPHTDLGNAERLAAQHRQDIRYCHTWGKWLIWDGTRFAVDETGAIVQRTKRTVRSIYADAEAEPDDKRRIAIVKHATASERAQRISAMINLSQSEDGIPVRADGLDSDPWLSNFRNGTVDLRTGKLREHRRTDLLTKCIAVDYDAGAKCPTFLAFLAKIMDGNQELITFVQRAVGYSLTGSTVERVIFMLWGASGKNGKSTLLETLQAIFGDYGMNTPAETLMVKRDSGVPNDIARLKGVRFVTAIESDEGQRIAEAKVKNLTGGDTVSARFMRGEFFDFVPTFKLWIATNHKPVIRGTDQAIWDRIKLIPFAVRIPDAEQDKHLKPKLVAEAPGILAWAVQGCLDWQREGLSDPADVVQATKGYRAEMDVIGRFFDECCRVDGNASVTASALYQAYDIWCKDSGERAVSKIAMGKYLTEHNFDSARVGKDRTRSWIGLELAGEPQP